MDVILAFLKPLAAEGGLYSFAVLIVVLLYKDVRQGRQVAHGNAHIRESLVTLRIHIEQIEVRLRNQEAMEIPPKLFAQKVEELKDAIDDLHKQFVAHLIEHRKD